MDFKELSRARRFGIAASVLIALLTAVRLAAPPLLQIVAEKTAAASLDGSCQVGSVNMTAFRGRVQFGNVSIDGKLGDYSLSGNFDEIILDLSLRNLVRFSSVVDIVSVNHGQLALNRKATAPWQDSTVLSFSSLPATLNNLSVSDVELAIEDQLGQWPSLPKIMLKSISMGRLDHRSGTLEQLHIDAGFDSAVIIISASLTGETLAVKIDCRDLPLASIVSDAENVRSESRIGFGAAVSLAVIPGGNPGDQILIMRPVLESGYLSHDDKPLIELPQASRIRVGRIYAAGGSLTSHRVAVDNVKLDNLQISGSGMDVGLSSINLHGLRIGLDGASDSSSVDTIALSGLNVLRRRDRISAASVTVKQAVLNHGPMIASAFVSLDRVTFPTNISVRGVELRVTRADIHRMNASASAVIRGLSFTTGSRFDETRLNGVDFSSERIRVKSAVVRGAEILISRRDGRWHFPQAPPSEGKERDVIISSTRLEKAKIEIVDEDTGTRIEGKLTAELTNLHLPYGPPAHLTANLAVPDIGEINTAGSFGLTADSPYTDLNLTITSEDLFLPAAEPVVRPYAPVKIKSGGARLSLAVALNPERLKGNADVDIAALQLDPPSDGTPPYAVAGIPIHEAIDLLIDEDDMIRLNVPFSGSLSDIQLDLTAVIQKAVGNVLRKTIFGPFTALGKSSDETIPALAPIPFDDDQALLSDTQAAAIMDLATALKKRPRIQLVLTPVLTDTEVERRGHQTKIDRLGFQRIETVSKVLTDNGIAKARLLAKPVIAGGSGPMVRVALEIARKPDATAFEKEEQRRRDQEKEKGSFLVR